MAKVTLEEIMGITTKLFSSEAPDEIRIVAKFVPLPDITAYEVALIFKNLSGGLGSGRTAIFSKTNWDELDYSLKRHFVAPGT